MDKQEIIKKKILSQSELGRMVAYWQFKGLKVTAAFGTFDILHPSIIELITNAKKHGDILVVGIKNDETVKKDKGAKFPIITQDVRAFDIASLQVVAAVYICETDSPAEFVNLVKPKEVTCCIHSPEKDRLAVEQSLKAFHGKLVINQPTIPWSELVKKICQQ